MGFPQKGVVMAYTISYNRPTSVPAAEVSLTPWGVASEQYASTDVKPGSATYVNISSPFGRAENAQVRSRTVQDIYKNTNVDRALHLPTKQGTECTYSLNQLWSIEDAADPTAPKYVVPFKIRVTFTVANIPEVLPANILDGLSQIGGLIHLDGQNTLAQVLRGATDVVHNS
jgi:hypothetical protein